MKKILQTRWILLLVLGIFIAIKIPHLFYPYYWDESWPYATAVNALFEHGISLMPNAIDDNISRGHPLFFHVIAAVWMNIFGGSHVAMHSFALLISLAFLVVVYEAGLRLFNPRVGAIALLLMASQEMYIVQSSALLFEVLVGLLCFLSLYCYIKEKYVLTAVFLSMLFYTKESGMMMGFVLGIDAWVAFFNKKTDRKIAYGRLLSIAVPCVLIGIYFFLQRYLKGWFIFPFYSESLEDTWNMYWYKFRMAALKDVVYSSLKYYYYILLAVMAVVAAIKSKMPRYLAYLLPFVTVYYLVDDMRAGRIMPSVPFFITFIAIWIWSAYMLCRYFSEVAQRRFVFLGMCFILVFIAFSASNFYIYRYMIAAIMPALFIASALLNLFISRSYKWLYYVSLACFATISWYAITGNKAYHGDCDLNAYKAMEVEQAVIDYMETNQYHDRYVASGGFLEVVHLTDTATGFLRKNKHFKHVKWTIDDSTELIIFNNIENDARYDEIKKGNKFEMVYRFEKGDVWSEVYERRRQ